jgi:hypothetical protein
VEVAASSTQRFGTAPKLQRADAATPVSMQRLKGIERTLALAHPLPTLSPFMVTLRAMLARFFGVEPAHQVAMTESATFIRAKLHREFWRRGSESNRRIKVLQTSPLPLGYRAPAQYVRVPSRSNRCAEHEWNKDVWSGRRDLNPRLRPWQGRTLPLSYSRSMLKIIPHL